MKLCCDRSCWPIVSSFLFLSFLLFFRFPISGFRSLSTSKTPIGMSKWASGRGAKKKRVTCTRASRAEPHRLDTTFLPLQIFTPPPPPRAGFNQHYSAAYWPSPRRSNALSISLSVLERPGFSPGLSISRTFSPFRGADPGVEVGGGVIALWGCIAG